MPLASQRRLRRFALGAFIAGVGSIGSAATPAPMPADSPVPTVYAESPYQGAPYAGHVNHAHQSPAFRWGWFGAEHFYPSVQWHRDYNGEVIRWTRQRRY